MNETNQANSTPTPAEAKNPAPPATAEEWAAMTFEAMEYAIPTKAEFMTDAKKQAVALPFLRAVLGCDDKKLEAAIREAPVEHVELLEWFDGLANDYERNAEALRRAAFRIGVALTRLELEAAQ